MNPKNTLLLLFTLVMLVAGLYVIRSRPAPTVATDQSSVPVADAGTTRDVLEDELGEVVKIVVSRRDEPQWVFEKKTTDEDETPTWYLTAPAEFKVVSWEVDKLPQQLKNLRFDISYAPGEAGGVTAEQAGLASPHAAVTLVDADGTSTSVEIGGPAGEQETYVRQEGSDRICVAKSSLTGLFKKKAVEYREKLLWNFDAKNAVRLEITERTAEGGATAYVFARDGARWMIEEPITARATTNVADAVNALSRLRVIQWQDDAEDRLGMYGLESAGLTVRVTIEEEVDVKDDSTEEAEPGDDDAEAEGPPKTEIRTKVFAVHVSDRSPIGEETKTYLRTGDSSAVATIMKTTVDKLRPNMIEWRDMRITAADVTAATSISFDSLHGAFQARKQGGQWRRASDDALLDADAVDEALVTVRDLTATAFVDGVAAISFDAPQVSIRMEVPGVEGGEHITIGDYTDATSKRLVYVRRGNGSGVAKVRTSDIAPLLRAPVSFLDRTVFDLVKDGIESVAIESVNPMTEKRRTLRYDKEGARWVMASPIRADLRPDAMEQLITALSGLRAERVVAESDQSTAFGLHDPAVVTTITYAKPHLDSQDAGDADVQPETISLSMTSHDGQCFAKRADASVIYELDRKLLDQLQQEFLTDSVWSFEQEEVTGFSVATAGATHTFDRQENRWIYRAEPDLPLDTKSVEDLLLRIRDLKVVRYVEYDRTDASVYGLDRPEVTIAIESTGSATLTLVTSNSTDLPGQPIGLVVGRAGVLALESNVAERCRVDLAELESKN